MGKWIAPKGGLSSSEHAELLFVVLCNGADIVEFFGTEVGSVIDFSLNSFMSSDQVQVTFIASLIGKSRTNLEGLINDHQNVSLEHTVAKTVHSNRHADRRSLASQYVRQDLDRS